MVFLSGRKRPNAALASGRTSLSALWLAPLLALWLAGCGGAPPPDPFHAPPAPSEDPAKVTWNLEQNGVRLLVETADDLNRQKDLPLGLTMCVYQLRDFAALQHMALTPKGIDALLNCSMDTGKDVVSAREWTLQPGQTLEVTMDRAESARYMAVVAGFAHLRPELCFAVQPFPLHQESQGFWRTKVYSAAPVDVLIRLSAESIILTGVERVQ